MKQTRIRTLLAGIMLVTAATLPALGAKESLSKLGMRRIEGSVQNSIGSDDSLRIVSTAADITIIRDKKTNRVTAGLTGYSSTPIELKISSVGSHVQIYTDWKRKTGISTKELRLNVHIPTDFSGELAVNSVSGSVSVPEGNVRRLRVETTAGDASLSGITADDIFIKSIFGDIRGSRLVSKELQASATSGNISLSANTEESITISSVSGDMHLSGQAGQINAKSTSGDIELLLDDVRGPLSAASIAGDISIAIPKDAHTFGTISSISGDRTVNIAQAASQNSAKKTQYSAGEALYEVSASSISGDITVTE